MSTADLGIEKLRRIFHEVEDIGEPVVCPVRIEDGVWTPPSYIVRLVLSMCGFKTWGPDEKVTWTAFVRYKEVGFKVRDWKRTTWTIEADSADKRAFDAAHELKRKIVDAAKILDDHLATAFREEVKADRFFIDNTYLKVRITYEHFKVEYVCNEALPQSGVSLGEQLAAAAESMSRRGYNGCAAVAFYFSAVEVLLDVFYAFGNKDVDYETFKKGSEWDWKKRFKHVLPVSTCGELASIYERLLKIKRNIRDRVLHGMGGERKASSSLSPDWGSCRSHTSILTLWMGWDGFHSLMRRSPMCLQPLTSSIRGYPKTNRGLTRFSTRNPCWRFLCLVDAAMKSLRPCQNLISRIGYTLSKNTWTTC